MPGTHVWTAAVREREASYANSVNGSGMTAPIGAAARVECLEAIIARCTPSPSDNGPRDR